jgi:predicted GNAT superfamily acetyltransferase
MSSSALSRPAITVRPVESVEEYRACQQIQRQAWGITEDGYVVPVATMISVQHAGGLVLGAFDEGQLVGFAFGYLGRVRGRWALYSQLAGVDPTVQDRGVGRQLKLAQRQWAKEQGLALVAWSYDPLQAGNANFNLRRLGAFSRTYEVNYFGERTDALNAGLDTDRLLVEWPVDDVPAPWAASNVRPMRVGGWQLNDSLDQEIADAATANAVIEVEIPMDLPRIKSRDPDLARAWQQSVRTWMLAAFARGYVACDFVREQDADAAHGFYVLRLPRAGVEL